MRDNLQLLQIMSVEQSDSDQMVLLTPASSFGPTDTVGAIETPLSTGQLVVTSQVPTQAMTNTSANANNL